jgi:hypothetical protein
MLPVLRISFLLGFRTIYLLGADFKMSEKYTYHFDEQREKGAVNCNNNTYDRLKSEYLPALKPFLEEEGVNVYNCNPDSALDIFEYKSFDQAIQESIEPLGDVTNERTWGMYSKPTEREKWKVEPPDSKKGHLAYIKGRPSEPVHDAVITVQHFGEQKEKIPIIPIAPVMPRDPKLPQPPRQINVSVPPVPRMPPMPKMSKADVPKLQHIRDNVMGFKPMPDVDYNTAIPLMPVHPNEKSCDKNKLSKKIIKSLPCGSICDGSSDNSNTDNITIKDDGN